MVSVLLLEDDDDLRDTLELALHVSGIDSVRSLKRVEDLTALGPRVADDTCAILDVNLGHDQPTGIDASEWLRSNGYAGSIVFLTGHAGAYPQLREACERFRGTLLEKPAPIPHLISFVRESAR